MTNPSSSNKKMKSASNPPIPSLPQKEEEKLTSLLQTFTTRHQSQQRPTAVITSGGTATDLEVNSVRFLDNFSTGLRGAISVEEFLKRGYAVVHLWRRGSAVPYLRVLHRLMEGGGAGDGRSLGFGALGALFDGQGDAVCDGDGGGGGGDGGDPWLTSTAFRTPSPDTRHDDHHDTDSSGGEETKLSKTIRNSSLLRSKLRERARVVDEGLLLTVPFRTVEEYLAKLQICTRALADSQSLGLVYLAAAVSDFYIPHRHKALHKIQSRDYALPRPNAGHQAAADAAHKPTDKPDGSAIQVAEDGNGIVIRLTPVPKCISLLRQSWAPDAFCVSFKLETDDNILRQKAQMAMDRYKVHMVIGNILATRHQQVFVMHKPNSLAHDHATTQQHTTSTTPHDTQHDDPSVHTLQISNGTTSTSSDELEHLIVSHVVEQHFSYIATNYHTAATAAQPSNTDSGSSSTTDPLMAGAEAVARHNRYLQEKRRALQRDVYWNRVRDLGLQFLGHAIGMYLTYALSSTLQRRMR